MTDQSLGGNEIAVSSQESAFRFTDLATELQYNVLSYMEEGDLFTVRGTSHAMKACAERISECFAMNKHTASSAGMGFIKTLSLVANPEDNTKYADQFTKLGQELSPEMGTHKIDAVYIRLERSDYGRSDRIHVAHPIYFFAGLKAKSLVLSGIKEGRSFLYDRDLNRSYPYKTNFDKIIHIMSEKSESQDLDAYVIKGGPELVAIMPATDDALQQSNIENLRLGFQMSAIISLLTVVVLNRTGQAVTLACQDPCTQDDCNSIRSRIVATFREAGWYGMLPSETTATVDRFTVCAVNPNEDSHLGLALRLDERAHERLQSYYAQSHKKTAGA